jgi:manganese efflux pump family protein
MGETGRVSRLSGTRWYGHATTLVVTGMVLAWTAAGCSSPSAVTGGSATSCYQFAAQAIQRHVTVAEVPVACQGLSQVEVNVAVSRALRAAAAGVRGKVRQRQVIARDSPYVAALIRAVPASGPPEASVSPSGPPGGPAVAASPSRPPSREPLSLAALAAWLVTAGLGVSMMARWIIRARRQGSGQRPVLNFTHLGLALTGLLVWISYLATSVPGLAWAACGLLLAAASLGMTLVFLGPASTATARLPGDGPAPAGHPPVFVIAAHITAACITILLATLAAISAG